MLKINYPDFTLSKITTVATNSFIIRYLNI